MSLAFTSDDRFLGALKYNGNGWIGLNGFLSGSSIGIEIISHYLTLQEMSRTTESIQIFAQMAQRTFKRQNNCVIDEDL
jgi:hypothetical protein